jgi:signal peptidase II
MLVLRTVTERIPILGDLVGIQQSLNPGIAFGLRLPPVYQEALIVFAAILIFFVGLRTAKTLVQRIGYGLIVGGALANIVDRVIDGYVTDYIQVSSFYIFNLADSCITVGVAILLLESMFWQRSKNQETRTR